jgi:hypothetical protein
LLLLELALPVLRRRALPNGRLDAPILIGYLSVRTKRLVSRRQPEKKAFTGVGVAPCFNHSLCVASRLQWQKIILWIAYKIKKNFNLRLICLNFKKC